MAYNFGSPFGSPWFEGISSSADVPGRFQVAIGGRPFMVDLTGYKRRSLAGRRQPVDDGAEVGENSLNTEGLWSRSQSDWSLGSGQTFYDNPDSDRRRFRRSVGVDVWDRDCATLLPDVGLRKSATGTNLRLVATGDRLYFADGQSVFYTTDPTVVSPTWTTVTGTPAANVTDMTTDGYDVYVAFGTSDLYKISGAGSAAAAFGAVDTDLVGYTNGRLMSSDVNKVYEVDSVGARTLLYTHPLTAWSASGFTSSPSNAYVFGDSGGGQTSIYRFGVQENGSLTAAIYAGTLPRGETLYEMDYYAGAMLMATSEGVRVAQVAGDGTLVVGPAVDLGSGSRCVSAAGRFMWFGWSDPYGEGSAGLGRADLSVFLEEGTPPFATDLQVAGQTGVVLAAESFGGRRYFAVSAVGVYGEEEDRVASGWLETGRVRYSTLERKVSALVDLAHDPLPAGGEVVLSLSSPSESLTEVGTSDQVGTVTSFGSFSSSGYNGEWQELRATLVRPDDVTDTPVLRRLTLRALPAPKRIREIVLPLVIKQRVSLANLSVVALDVLEEVQFIEGLEETQELVNYQEGSRTYTVYVDQSELGNTSSALELDWTDGFGSIEGILTVRLLTVPEG